MNNKNLFLIALISLLPATAYTGAYKWTDKEGKIHYSQTRPSSDIKSESLRIHGRKPLDSSISNNTDKKDTKNKKDKITEKKENKASKKESKAACLAARKNLAQMKSSGRIRQRDADGNINYLSAKQKRESMKKEQQIIKNNCK